MDPPLLTFAPVPILLVLALCVLLHALTMGLEYAQGRPTPREEELQRDISTARAQIRGLSKVADFVIVSKLERQAGKWEKELGQVRAAKAADASGASSPAAAVRSYVRPAALALLVLAFWGTPLASGLPVSALGPVAVFLSLPGWPRGTLGVVAWTMLCNSAAATAVAAAARAAGVAPKKEEAGGLMGMATKAMGMLGGGGGARR